VLSSPSGLGDASPTMKHAVPTDADPTNWPDGDLFNGRLGHGLRRRQKNATEVGAGRFEKPAPDARAAPPEAHESLISRKTGAEVPLTGLSVKHRRHREPGISELPVRIVRLFPPACAHENSGVFVTRSGGGRTREPGHAERSGFLTDRRRD
jgi:hypothetical protein